MKNTTTLLLLATSGLISAQTLSNGSFEQNTWDNGDQIATEISPQDNYVDFDTISATAWNLNKNGILYTKAVNGTSDGRYAAEVINERGEISQDLVFSSAGLYSVSFDTFAGPNENMKFSVSLTGSSSGTQSASAAEFGTDGVWTSRTEQFNVSDPSETYKLAFTNFSNETSLYIDNVTVRQTSAVPEPTSALLGGLASLLLLRRRR